MVKGYARLEIGDATDDSALCHVDLPKLIKATMALAKNNGKRGEKKVAAFKTTGDLWLDGGKAYDPLQQERDANVTKLAALCGIAEATVRRRLTSAKIDGDGDSKLAAQTLGYAIHAVGKGIRGQTSW